MKLTHTDIDELVVLEPQVFGDARGYFFSRSIKNGSMKM